MFGIDFFGSELRLKSETGAGTTRGHVKRWARLMLCAICPMVSTADAEENLLYPPCGEHVCLQEYGAEISIYVSMLSPFPQKHEYLSKLVWASADALGHAMVTDRVSKSEKEAYARLLERPKVTQAMDGQSRKLGNGGRREGWSLEKTNRIPIVVSGRIVRLVPGATPLENSMRPSVLVEVEIDKVLREHTGEIESKHTVHFIEPLERYQARLDSSCLQSQKGQVLCLGREVIVFATPNRWWDHSNVLTSYLSAQSLLVTEDQGIRDPEHTLREWNMESVAEWVREHEDRRDSESWKRHAERAKVNRARNDAGDPR